MIRCCIEASCIAQEFCLSFKAGIPNKSNSLLLKKAVLTQGLIVPLLNRVFSSSCVRK